MNLPPNEDHKTSEWTLKNKKIIRGTGFDKEKIRTHVANYECIHCFREYIRFVEEDDFKELVVGESRWMWGWKK